MKNFKKIAITGALVLAVGATSLTAFAASQYSTPSQAAAALTGKSEEAVQAERSEGKTYGAIAAEAGKLEEFKTEMQEIRKDSLATRVENGTLTQEKADEILSNIQERQENCDGSGEGNGTEGRSGFRFGNGNENGSGNASGRRQNGSGNRQGGKGICQQDCDGSCTAE